MTKSNHLDPRVVELLSRAGVAWEVVTKRKHLALLVEGRQVAVLPRSYRANSGGNRSVLNVVAAVRRHLRTIGRIK